MKIGIDCRLWSETGVGRYIRNLVKELAEIDADNDYVLFAIQKDYEKVKLAIRNSHFTIVPVDIHWHSLSEQFQFTKILNNEQLDLMHFPYFSHPITYRKPFVITIHDLIISHFATGKASTLPLPLYYAKRLAFQRVLHHGIQHARTIIVPLHAVKDDIVQTFQIPKEKITVTYEGFDTSIGRQSSVVSRQQTTNDERPKDYFLYVGNAYPHKNVEGLIDGFLRFHKENTSYKLVLVGKEDYFYKRLKNKLSSKDRNDMIFLHNVGDAELAQLYTSAKAFVSASKMEGFGLPPLEAMAIGTPVLVSDIPSFREVCGDAALYFNPYDNGTIAKMMDDAVKSSQTEKNRRLNDGLQRAKQFSWQKMAEETLKVYQQAV